MSPGEGKLINGGHSLAGNTQPLAALEVDDVEWAPRTDVDALTRRGSCLQLFDQRRLRGVDHEVVGVVGDEAQFVAHVRLEASVPIAVFVKQRGQHGGVWRVGEAAGLEARDFRDNPLRFWQVPQGHPDIASEYSIDSVGRAAGGESAHWWWTFLYCRSRR